MNDLLISVCLEISRLLPDDESDLKISLGRIVGTENPLKFDASQGEEPEKGLNLCNAALALSGFDQSIMERSKECIQKIRDYFSLQLRLLYRRKMKGIYIIVDPEATNNVDVYEMTKMSLEGGVKVVQYRDKSNDREPFLDTWYRF